LSISSKLADYEASWELLSRLNFDELTQLAHRNNVELQKEDVQGNVQKARSKEEAIDILVASEFRESDLIELLGINRITKEEILNIMSISQLRKLANETGVLLEKSTLFGVKKAVKKKDVVKALKVLSVSKVREHAEKMGLIKKATKKTKKRKPTKAVARKPAVRKPAAKAVKRERVLKPEIIKPPAKETVQPLIVPARVEGKKLAQIVVPVQQAQLKPARVVEEIVREILIERQIVRRQLVPGQSRKGRRIKKKASGKILVKTKKAKKKT